MWRERIIRKNERWRTMVHTADRHTRKMKGDAKNNTMVRAIKLSSQRCIATAIQR